MKLKKFENIRFDKPISEDINFDDIDNEEESDELLLISRNRVRLNCGVECDYRKRGNNIYLTINMYDLYNGYGKMNNLKLLSDMFLELYNKGFKEGGGLYLDHGYYESIDDVTLELHKKI